MALSIEEEGETQSSTPPQSILLPPPSSQYKYTPLTHPTQIRILEILAAPAGSTEIHFLLHDLDLDASASLTTDFREYYALSYVWGAAEFTQTIYSVSGCIKVTENLYSALRHYRQSEESIFMWADGVCINQSDLEERSQQVLLMRRIYAEAERVFVYLGEEEALDRKAFDLITDLARTYANKIPATGQDPAVLLEVITELVPRLKDEDWAALTGFWGKSWFGRVWTFQEICLSRRAALSCGGLHVDFEVFLSFAWIFKSVGIGPWLRSDAAQANFTHFFLIILVQRFLRAQPPTETSLLWLIAAVRNRRATDPRDKIYGVLALASDPDIALFPPRYDVPYGELYETFAVHIIRKSGNLELLKYLYFDGSRAVTGLPTWVPNWSRPEHEMGAISPEDEPFFAAGKQKGSWNASTAIKDHILFVNAILIDTLDMLKAPHMSETKILAYSEEANLPAIRKMLDHIQDVATSTALSPLYTTEEARHSAQYRILMGDKSQERFRSTPEDARRAQSFTEALEHLFDPERPITEGTVVEWQQIESSMRSISWRRRLCSTMEGRVGWAPEMAEGGDSIAVLQGLSTPIVLRPVNGEVDDGEYFVIGACYIHDFMDGEAVEGREKDWREIKIL